MTTALMRSALRPLYDAARDAHPGLLIQRGYPSHETGAAEAKTRHIERICAIPASDYYLRAVQRWRTATANPLRFRQVELALETRLFIGLTGGGALETGCAIAHSYGVPYIPGSSIKGVTKAHVLGSPFARNHRAVCDELFGSAAGDDAPDGLAGLVNFHDAWWLPDQTGRPPMVQEVVTTHHPDYYGSEGDTPATDLDSPVPNAQIAVRGRFLFVLEGPPAWLELAEEMLTAALSQSGVGAKTRAGYGFFQAAPVTGGGARCPWVDDTVAMLAKKNNAKEDDTLRGKGLAAAWQALTDGDLKTQALADIRGRWEAQGWWESPPGGSAKQAKAIYAGS